MRGAFRFGLAFILVTLSSCSGPAPNNPTDVEVAEEVPRPRWVALAAEGHRTCAERDDGARYCWGDGVGRPRRVDAWLETPSVPYPCLFDEPGRIRCPMTDSPTELGKVATQDEGSPWVATVHTPPRACGINEAGWVYCFNSTGDGQAGFLHMMEGISPTGRSEYALDMRGIFRVEGGSHVATGQNHVCVLLRDGSIQCAGQRDRGQLGDFEEELALREEPTLVGVTGMDIAGEMTCAASQGRLFCWGGRAHQEGGLPNLVEGSEGAVDVALGNGLGCIIDRDRQLRCFSFDSDGFSDLGSVEGITSVQAMVSGDSGVCVRDDQGLGHCLRSDRDAQAEPILDGTEEIAIGSGYLCGRRGERWSCNLHDPVGRELDHWSEREGMCAREGERLVCVAMSGMPDSYPGGFQYSGVPIETPPIATLLTAGSWLCVETRDGRTLCAADALVNGGGDFEWNPTPTFRPLVGANGVQRLRAGYVHGCALLESGALHCFGRGAEGQVGLGMPETFRTEPFQVPVPSEGWTVPTTRAPQRSPEMR